MADDRQSQPKGRKAAPDRSEVLRTRTQQASERATRSGVAVQHWWEQPAVEAAGRACASAGEAGLWQCYVASGTRPGSVIEGAPTWYGKPISCHGSRYGHR